MTRKRNVWYAALLVLMAVVLGVGRLLWPVSQPASADITLPLAALDATANAGRDQATQAVAGLPATASHVRIQARMRRPATTSDKRTLSVRLHIDKGWHVNANPASLDFLIPTTVAAKADGHSVTQQTTYPPGVQSDIRLADTVIKVYENNTTIRSQLSPTADAAIAASGGLHVSVKAQACNDKGICLPPSVMKTRVINDKE